MSSFEPPPGLGRVFQDLELPQPLRRPGGDGERPAGEPSRAELGTFGKALQDAVGNVQELQTDVRQKYDALAKGEPVNLHDIYIASGKADVAFTLMLEVRNRLVETWQQISRSVV